MIKNSAQQIEPPIETNALTFFPSGLKVKERSVQAT